MDRLPQDMRPIGSHEGRHLGPVEPGIPARGCLRLGPDGINAGIGAATAGEVHDLLVDILVHKIERKGAGCRGESQPLRDCVDSNHPLGAHNEGRLDRHLPDRTAALMAIVSPGWMLQKSAAM